MWSMEGAELMRLHIDGEATHFSRQTRQMHSVTVHAIHLQSLAVSNRPNGSSLLFVEGGKYVAVWSLNKGRVGINCNGRLDYGKKWEDARACFAQNASPCIPALGVYRQGEEAMAGLDVDQSESTSFAIQVSGNFTCSMWNLEGVPSNRYLLLEPPEPANLLIMPGRETLLLDLQHPSKVCKMRVKHDPDDACGAALLTACDNGTVFTWDLEGFDKGQIMSELRSLSAREIMWTPFMMLVSAAQVLSFTFGPSIEWRHELKRPVHVVHKIMLLDFEYSIDVDQEMLFWGQTYGMMGVMCLFMFWAMTGAPQIVDGLSGMLQDTDMFEGEESKYGFCHLVVAGLQATKKFIFVVMQLFTTVLVAPSIMTMAKAVDCVSKHGGNALETHLDHMVLEKAPSIQCYKGDHLRLTVLVVLVIIPYVVMLIPFASVQGDCNYMPRSTLYSWRAWMPAARRKATNKNLGFLHQVPDRAFHNLVLETGQKIISPVIVSWMTAKPRTQMGLVSLVNIVIYALVLTWPPFIEEKFCVQVQHVKLLAVLVSLSGFVAACLNDPDSFIPVVLLAASLGVVIVAMVYSMLTVPARRPAVRVFTIEGDTSKHGVP